MSRLTTPRFILGRLVLLPAPAVMSKMVLPRWKSNWSARTLADTTSSRSAACGCQRRLRSDIGGWFQTRAWRHVGHLAVQHPLGRVHRSPVAGARRWFVWGPFIDALHAADEATFLTRNTLAADVDMSGRPDNLAIVPVIGLLTATGAPEPGPLSCAGLALMLGRRCVL